MFLPCKLARAFEISSMCMQRATADLILWHGDVEIIGAQHARGCSIHSCKKPLTHTALKQQYCFRAILSVCVFLCAFALCGKRHANSQAARVQIQRAVRFCETRLQQQASKPKIAKQSRRSEEQPQTCWRQPDLAVNANLKSLFAKSDFGCACSNTSRLASSSCPYSTPAGQTCSHALQPRHRSICV